MAFKSVCKETDSLLRKAGALAAPEEGGKDLPFGALPFTRDGTRARIGEVEAALELQREVLRTLEEYRSFPNLRERKMEEAKKLEEDIDFDKKFLVLLYMDVHPPGGDQIEFWCGQRNQHEREREGVLRQLKTIDELDQLFPARDGEKAVLGEEFGKLVAREEKNLRELEAYRDRLAGHLETKTSFLDFMLSDW